jgi:lysophospholipase L1-like esterase
MLLRRGLIGIGLMMSSAAALAQGMNTVDATTDLVYFNARPLPANAFRVLYIGDSLTYHTRIANVWAYVSGMAATTPANDFVHLTATYMQQRIAKRPVEILLDNGGNGKIGTMLEFLKVHPVATPSLVVMQGGENDAFDDTYKQTYEALLDFYRAEKVPVIVLGDWYTDGKRDYDCAQAAARSYACVDLRAIQKVPDNTGNAGPYNNKGVASHPNDAGMKAIAAEIERCFDRLKLPGVKVRHTHS